MQPNGLTFALEIIVLLFSVILHEVMHGMVALRFGDTTAQRAGRLTFNPIPHIDPIGTVLLPLMFLLPCILPLGGCSGFFLAWAKPVPVNPLNFSNLRKGELAVSSAGILANFGLALAAAILFRILNALPQSFPAPIGEILIFTVMINLVLAVFNLVPIPPLDGSKVLLSQLPFRFAKEYQKLESYGFIILLILLFTGALGFVFGIARLITVTLLGL